MSDVDSLKAQVARTHSRWIKDHPDATLAELDACLAEALNQCSELAGEDDPLVGHHREIPEPLATYLSGIEGHHREPFGYFETVLEDEMQVVDDLIEAVGPAFQVADLPSPE